MPNIDSLVDRISQIIAERKVYSTILDFRYAYDWVALYEKTSEQFKFLLVGENRRESTDFKNGFLGLTSIPTKFQKFIDTLIEGFPQANAFIDYIIIVPNGKKMKFLHL